MCYIYEAWLREPWEKKEMRKVPVLLGASGGLIAGYTINDDNFSQQMGLTWTAQTFLVGAAATTKSARIRVFRTGLPGTVQISIRATVAGKPSGADLAADLMTNGNDFTSSSPGTFWKFTWPTPLALSASTTYALVFRAPSGDGSNFTTWRSDATTPLYTGGSNAFSTDGGVTWTLNTATDMMFTVNS